MVLAGARECGKSALFAQYAGGEATDGSFSFTETDVIEMARTVVSVGATQLQIMLWALTGLARHRETEVTYLSVGQVFVLVYDRYGCPFMFNTDASQNWLISDRYFVTRHDDETSILLKLLTEKIKR